MTYDFSILREIRKRRNLTINDLSKACGVSYVALSKLERNQANPELRTLDRISRALEMPTHALLALAEHKHPVSAAEEARQEVDGFETRVINLDGTRVCYVSARKGAAGCDPDMHEDDYEHCFVIDGRVKVSIRSSEYELGAGEGLAWDCMFEHTYEALEKSRFISVLTPKRP